MKFNWPTGLFIFFTIFVASLIFIVYQSRQVHDSLVIENYYEEDINYQKVYDKKQHTADLTIKVRAEYDKSNRQVILTFPIDSVSVTSGNILLYNPYTSKSDVNYDFNIGKGSVYKLELNDAKPGRWKLKIDWKRGEKEFYQEEEIII